MIKVHRFNSFAQVSVSLYLNLDFDSKCLLQAIFRDVGLRVVQRDGKMVFRGVQGECWECLSKLIDKTVKLAAQSKDVEEKARDEAFLILRKNFKPGAIPAFIATRFQEKIREITGNPDPFLELKREEIKVAKSLAEWLRPRFENNLRSLFSFSALGNALDFFRDPEELKKDGETGLQFSIDDLDKVEELISKNKGIILLLADNAGEIYFDMPVLEYLLEMGCKPFYVVKGGPAQNDLTIDDVKWAGYEQSRVPIVSHGSSVVGLDLNKVSDEFKKLFDEATLIVGKGMGHYETMSHLALDKNILFLLKAKCNPVAGSLGVNKDEFVAYWG